jgi:hypothetical protein
MHCTQETVSGELQDKEQLEYYGCSGEVSTKVDLDGKPGSKAAIDNWKGE